MQKNYKDTNAKRLAAYSALAAVVITGHNDAAAEIIYNDFEDVTIEVGDLFELDMDGDGTFDFHFRAASTTGTAGTWSFASIFGSYSSLGVGGPSNQVLGYSGPHYYYGSFLEDGDPIGPGGDWNISASSIVVIASNFYGVSYGAFPGNGDGFLGVKFETGGNVHYGWIRLEAELNPVVVIVKDAAFENTPDTEIEAGETISVSVHEVSAEQVSVYAFSNTIYIQNMGLQDASVSVYNITGQLVYVDELLQGNNRITIDQPAGNYFVKVKSNEGELSKQLYLN